MANKDKQNALKPSSLPHHAIPFDQLEISEFKPELEKAIKLAKSRVEKIQDSEEPPNFENTILALETSSEEVDLITSVFYNLLGANTNTELQRLAGEIGPMAANFSSDIQLSEKLFNRIRIVYENEFSKLPDEEKMLLDKYYTNFTRNGALLPIAEKDKLRDWDAQMSQLGPKFNENVLKATNQFKLILRSPEEIAGLPKSLLDSAKQLAQDQKEPEAWIFTLHAPSYVPFMQHADHRASREKMYKAFSTRAMKGDTDNTSNILRILELRDKRAKLLGFKDHASFVLEKRMAESSDKVFEFLNKLKTASVHAAKKDIQDVRELAVKCGFTEELMPWDFAYWSEKLKEQRFQFKAEDLRPYFQLENVVQGIFKHAERLYSIEFKLSETTPVYHPDVTAYEVFESSTNRFLGLFYADFFPRESKNGGAWMTNFHEQGLYQNEVHRPHVAIVCNFTKPTHDTPSLITFDEVNTLFHEFGHALHSLLSDCRYRTLSGTNVYWDFVELPSQIMENWASEQECLDMFAKHYKTGEKLPSDLAKKIKDSEKFQAGYSSLRQLTFAWLDMMYHTTPVQNIQNPADFEEEIVGPLRVLPPSPGACFSYSFSHIFGGGYSAGYYSYKWAEVLDADAFELFKESGLYNQDVAKRFRQNILSRGGTSHPMELYKRFRGREPNPDALLKRDGLI